MAWLGYFRRLWLFLGLRSIRLLPLIELGISKVCLQELMLSSRSPITRWMDTLPIARWPPWLKPCIMTRVCYKSSVEMPISLSVWRGRIFTADPPSTSIQLILTSHSSRVPLGLFGAPLRLPPPLGYLQPLRTYGMTPLCLHGQSRLGSLPTSSSPACFSENLLAPDFSFLEDGDGYVVGEDFVFLQQYGSLTGESGSVLLLTSSGRLGSGSSISFALSSSSNIPWMSDSKKGYSLACISFSVRLFLCPRLSPPSVLLILQENLIDLEVMAWASFS
ncbi:hypothetical protein LIER_18096 [Lithospermum erythrorhizon]|uniref:Uncharacterized protein n=1 Tax=Lithospermum erythrorhizon TaxID=34254 RepID=A0AAV3QCX6_LITER